MRWVRRIIIAAAAALLLIQLVPYGRAHDNPAVIAEPRWDRAATRDLAVRACFDCHSNQTRWPWYSYVAPTSWLVQSHVDEGREALNFSEWNRVYEEADDAAETVLEGEMPPRSYTWLHPASSLSVGERRMLAAGLRATIGGHEDEHED